MKILYLSMSSLQIAWRVTPAMESGITNHIWGWEELLGLAKTSRKAA
jgi:hypothetical protein